MAAQTEAVTLLPWLAPYWRQLVAYIAHDRIPQALLLIGAAGIGKDRLSTAFAQRLLCKQPADFACGSCPSCILFTAGTHPDYFVIEPAGQGKRITVDSVRSLISSLSLKPHYARHRIVIFPSAHQMNIAAANSLLKTLEEPDEDTVILMLTDTPSALPATILSRCQRLNVATPPPEVAGKWLREQRVSENLETLLALGHGAPLAALALAKTDVVEQRNRAYAAWRSVFRQLEDPVAIAATWAQLGCEQILDWMLTWAVDMVRLASAADHAALYNPDLRDSLRSLARQLDRAQLFSWLDLLYQSKKLLSGQANRQLVIENLLIRWSGMASARTQQRY